MSANLNTTNSELMEVEEIEVSDGGAARFAAIEVKSDADRFNVKWEAPAKLLRFDEGENQWKERGEGKARILQCKDDSDKYMFVFRREAVGKLAAHHYLQKGMNVKVHPKNEKALLWSAFKDYTDDDEGFPESFVMRFSTKETTQDALKQMEECITTSNV
ncbi:unnamed protein product [Phytomonas sp. Hart1]|nr:unnamed protein product [Phytomonas sp. Hart1]|eukprot:CCW66747.1 unnamed protein product [Phytomonas sp. isolate Hart1]